MISPEDVRELSNSNEEHCLTVYLNTGPNLSRSSFLASYKNLIRNLTPSVPEADRKVFDAVTTEAYNRLSQFTPEGNSTLIFATENGWRQYSSRVPVRDEAWWGRPNVHQLLWLLEEYRPYGVIIADQQKVRFLAVRLGEFEVYREFSGTIDTTDWQRQRLGSSHRGRAYQKGGNDLERFNSRYMEQVRGFWRSLHKPLAELITRYHVHRIVVAGNKSLLPEFTKTLPESISRNIVAQVTMDAFISPTDAVKKISAEIEAWERRIEMGVVSQLLDFASVSNKAAIGLEPTLKYLQEGRAAKLVVVKDFDREVLKCAHCEEVVPDGTGGCRQCNASVLQKARMAMVLPKLVYRYNVPVEIVKGEAGVELEKSGGIGVFLRF